MEFDPYIWNFVDGHLYIARESYLRTVQKERPRLKGNWSEALAVHIALRDLRLMECEGEA